MDLKQCLNNLKYDLGNGGIRDETFAMNCYVTMANKAHRLLKSDTSDQEAQALAEEYLSLCANSGNDALEHATGE